MAVGFRTQVAWFAGAAWSAVLVSSIAAGCGGQVDPVDGQPTSEETLEAEGTGVDGSAVDGSAVDGSAVDGSAVDGSAVDGSAVDGSGGSPAEPSSGDLGLEPCDLGPLPAETERPCNWLASGRCYDTKAAACSCICPRDGPSLCLSDFYGGDGSQTKVSCR